MKKAKALSGHLNCNIPEAEISSNCRTQTYKNIFFFNLLYAAIEAFSLAYLRLVTILNQFEWFNSSTEKIEAEVFVYMIEPWKDQHFSNATEGWRQSCQKAQVEKKIQGSLTWLKQQGAGIIMRTRYRH